MKYTIDVFKQSDYLRVGTTTDPYLTDILEDQGFNDVSSLLQDYFIEVTNNFDAGGSFKISSPSAYDSWIEGLQRITAWRDATSRTEFAEGDFVPGIPYGRWHIAAIERASRRHIANTSDITLADLRNRLALPTLEEFFEIYYINIRNKETGEIFEHVGLNDFSVWIKGENTINKAVNPSHYRGLLEGIPDLGWLDVESRKEKYSDPKVFLGAIDLQENKYMERLGKKDDPLQERKKSLFYKAYAILYMENGCKPIKADLVHEWMAKMPEMPGHCL